MSTTGDVGLKLEVVVIPVSDVDRAKQGNGRLLQEVTLDWYAAYMVAEQAGTGLPR